MGVGRFLIDFGVMHRIASARLYWNPLRKQKRLHAQQCDWQKGIIPKGRLWR